jgi:Domain of unknown function (DUF397)
MLPTEPDLTNATWAKSSHSECDKASCVEVDAIPGRVGVRDTKQRGGGPVLAFDRSAWSAFLTERR